jgi:hypothetical protein
VAENPFEKSVGPVRRILEEHARRIQEELEHALGQMRAAMNRAQADMDREAAEFEAMMAEARRQLRGSRDWTRADDWIRRPKRRRPPTKPAGGEPAPVKPRPKPTPLVDGAEAPIE